MPDLNREIGQTIGTGANGGFIPFFALSKIDAVNGFLTQGVDESFSYEACIRQMREILK